MPRPTAKIYRLTPPANSNPPPVRSGAIWWLAIVLLIGIAAAGLLNTWWVGQQKPTVIHLWKGQAAGGDR